MKIKASLLLLLSINVFYAQEITDKDLFKKCRKEFSKKVCLSDEDGDKIPLYLDQCPKESGPEENNGCPWPDTDGDGVVDKDDACPTVAGPIENMGCPWPDTDGDGILDKDDRCPTVPGVVENDGCPARRNPHRFSQEELQKIKEDFLKQIQNNNYHAVADLIFKKILTKPLKKNKIIYITVLDVSVPGCGSDDTDYSDDRLINELIFKTFWDHGNFKKFVNLFPDRTIVPVARRYDGYNEDLYSELREIISFKDIPQMETKYVMIYNAKGNFDSNINMANVKNPDNNYIDLSFHIKNKTATASLNEEMYYFKFKGSGAKEISRLEYEELIKKEH